MGFRSSDWNVLMVMGTTMAMAAVLLVTCVSTIVRREKHEHGREATRAGIRHQHIREGLSGARATQDPPQGDASSEEIEQAPSTCSPVRRPR